MLGFEMCAVYRPLDLRGMDAWIKQSRESKGLRLMSKFGAARGMPTAMETGFPVGLVADQSGGDRGVFTPFFGRLTSTYKMIGLLAMRFGATIACGVARRLESGDPSPTGPWEQTLAGHREIARLQDPRNELRYAVEVTDTFGPEDWNSQPDPLYYIVLAIVLVERFAPRGLARVSVLAGLLLGTVVALFVPGMVDGSGIGDAAWFAVVTPFHFGLPTFDLASIVSMLVVGLVIMTETTGDMVAVGEVVGRPVSKRTLADGLRADGLGTVVGGVFNTFPYTAFAQNVGLVALTGVRSRYVATAAGGILVVLGLVPKVAAVVEAIPHAVLGGAGVALFGMVAASGIRTLSKVRFDNRNVLVVALPLGIALLPTVAPSIYAAFPTWFTLVFDSGISAGAVAAILLNLLLGSRSVRERYGDDPAVGSYDAVRSTAPIAVPPRG